MKRMINILLFSNLLFPLLANTNGCKKNEILKMIDIGFSKEEIKKTCAKKESWYYPKIDDCKKYNGYISSSGCNSYWQDAVKICSEQGGRLPTDKELTSIVRNCGSKLFQGSTKKTKNPIYEVCYKREGFDNTGYWTSSFLQDDDGEINYAWRIEFGYSDISYESTGNINSVRCIK